MAQESGKMDADEPPSLCANSCGFFGSAATLNLCSQCYRDLVLTQTKAAKDAGTVRGETDEQMPLQPGDSDAVAASSGSKPVVNDSCASADPSGSPSRQPPSRCFACRKRVGLTGFKCRCGNVFCYLHRYSDKHGCPYDYGKAARDAITKANPIIKADKVDKI